MPLGVLRPSTAMRASRALGVANTSSCIPKATSCFPSTRNLSSSSGRQAADAEHEEEDRYDPPTGWLFGVKPGEKYQKEGWEGAFALTFGGGMLFAVVGYAFKPDTSIQTWALEEARRRLEVEGILAEPEDKP